jgi:hypothetical protein
LPELGSVLVLCVHSMQSQAGCKRDGMDEDGSGRNGMRGMNEIDRTDRIGRMDDGRYERDGRTEVRYGWNL